MVAQEPKVIRASTIFSEAKEKGILDIKCGQDYIDVGCGCTSRKLGDAKGILRIFTSGQFLITCQCNAEHIEGKMSPAEFEKHALHGAQSWKDSLWVMFDSQKMRKHRHTCDDATVKIPLRRAGLLKYYKHGSNMLNRGLCRRRWNFHRDEFVRCCRCRKQRRFRLRTKEECRIYHDALGTRRWKCHQRPYDPITCEDGEERQSRKASRGCMRARACKGCTSCVCFGCLMCRFPNCNCRTCLDFMQNAAA